MTYTTMLAAHADPAYIEAAERYERYWCWYREYQTWLAEGGTPLRGIMHGDDIARAADGGPQEECLRLGHWLEWLWKHPDTREETR